MMIISLKKDGLISKRVFWVFFILLNYKYHLDYIFKGANLNLKTNVFKVVYFLEMEKLSIFAI